MKPLYILIALLAMSCKNNDSPLTTKKKSFETIPVKNKFLIDGKENSVYQMGDYLFEGNKNLVFDFFQTGHPPLQLKSKGDTLYSDSLYTILTDIKKASGTVYKKYIPKYKFEDFKSGKLFKNHFAKPNFSTDPLARRFQTAIRKGCVDSAINFAGHYTIAEWGCGMECLMMAVVDRENGKIYYSNNYLPFDTIDGHWGVRYKKDSRLIIVNSYLLEDYPGYIMQQSWRKLSYYQWKGDGFIKLP